MATDLQLSLLLIGALIIAAVVLFNRYQQRRFYRTRSEAAAAPLQTPERPSAAVEPRANDRREPTFKVPNQTPVPTPPKAESANAAVAADDVPWPTWIDGNIDYVASIQPLEPIGGRDFFAAPYRSDVITRPLTWLGLNAANSQWERIRNASEAQYTRVIAVLQLLNRSGPATGAELGVFCDLVQQLAEHLMAVVDCPDRQAALARAQQFDQICAAVDVEIALHALADEQRPFPAAKLVSLAESAGMRIVSDGTLQYDDAQDLAQFRLRNEEQQPFIAGALDAVSTHAIVFEIDVPRASEGIDAFDRMTQLAKRVVENLGGRLVDDNRQPLGDAAIAAIRGQLQNLYATMQQHHLKPGSDLALRLFS